MEEVEKLLDYLKRNQTDNPGGGMRPIDYDIDCVEHTLKLLNEKIIYD